MRQRTAAQTDPVQLQPGRALTLLLRGLLRRCPNCGGGSLFSGWLKMARTCPSCRLVLDRRETDYFMGGYTINFLVSEVLIVLGAAMWIVLSWPEVPWRAVTWSLVILMVLAPVAFYPVAKTTWLAVDLIFRPVTLGDLDDHGESLAEPE